MGKFNELAQKNKGGGYLGEGTYEATITGMNIKTGDDARPAWATKSIEFVFESDGDRAIWNCELEPLQLKDGSYNDRAISIAMNNIENMGHNWNDVDSKDDFVSGAEQFALSGSALGAVVEIKVTEKESASTNPHTGKPYVNRYVYVNKLIEPGVVQSSVAADVEVF